MICKKCGTATHVAPDVGWLMVWDQSNGLDKAWYCEVCKVAVIAALQALQAALGTIQLKHAAFWHIKLN